MGRTIGLGGIWSFVLGFRSLVARLAPFKRESRNKEGEFFGNGKCELIANFSTTMVRQEVWREKQKVRIFGKGKCELTAIVRIFGMEKCKLIANFSATMMTSLPSISLSLYLSLSPSVPHAQYRKRFRASYNTCKLYLTLEALIDTKSYRWDAFAFFKSWHVRYMFAQFTKFLRCRSFCATCLLKVIKGKTAIATKTELTARLARIAGQTRMDACGKSKEVRMETPLSRIK